MGEWMGEWLAGNEALLAEIAGAAGVGLYLASYAALQFGFIRGQSYSYPILNMFAAGFVLISLAQSFNMASAVIQTCWIVISAIGIVRIFLLSRSIRFTEEERVFLDHKMPSVPTHLARRFLDSGVWCDLEAGAELTHEGMPVERLVYLADGEATVTADGRVVGQVGSDSLIGEITSVTGEPATASATLSRPSRCFCIDALQLRVLMRKHAPIQSAIERLVATEMQKKIVALNRRVEQGGEPAAAPAD